MTNSASATINARCGYNCMTDSRIFRGMRPIPGGTPDDRKLTGFGCFGPSDKVSDWISGRMAEGPTGIKAWAVDYSALVSSPRWNCAIIP
jgi:hypothetical protein